MGKGKIYIIRHGQTDWNVKHKLQGGTNIPLNETGRQMAVDASEKYKDLHVDICYSSPLDRAFETANIVLAGRNVQIIKDERLREMSFGDFEGVEEVFSMPDHPMYKFFKNPTAYEAMNKAETFDELYSRTRLFIDEILLPAVEEGKNVLVVGHGAMNLSIVNQLLNIPLEQFWDKMLGNCELMEVEI